MVRTYPFNPSTSSPNFSNLLVEDCETRNSNNLGISISNFKPHSAHFVGVPTSIHRPHEQLKSSPFLRTTSLPASGIFPRFGWVQNQQHHPPSLRRQSYVEENNPLVVSHLLSVPINLHTSAPSLSEEVPLENALLGPSIPIPNIQNNFVDLDERQYLEQQKQVIYSSEDIKPDVSYANLQSTMLSQQQQPPNYGIDYEKYLRAQEREQKAQYLRDLQQQAQQQKTRRLLTEVDYGGFEYERELMKDRQQNRPGNSSTGEELPPWLRGNPQPKNGYRGVGQGAPSSSTLQPNTFNTSMRREKSLPLDFNGFSSMQPLNQTNGFSNSTFNLGGMDNNYKSQLERQMQDRNVQKQRDRLEEDRLNKIYNQDTWDPWGKGGAGAPIRDKDGKLVADRSRLAQSWNKMLDTNLPHQASPGNSLNMGRRSDSLFPDPTAPSYGSNYSNSANTMPSFGGLNSSTAFPSNPSFGNAPVSEKDFYKMELQKQIDERKRVREIEKQREREEEARDRANFEKYAEKQRQELEAEKEKQRKKQEIAQRKFDEPGETKENNALAPPARGGQGGRKASNKPPDDGLEWWERTPQNRNRAESALVPTAQNRPPPNGRSAQNSAAARKPPSAARTSKPPSANPSRGSRQPSASQEINKPTKSARSSSIPPTPPPKASFESSENLIGRQNGDMGGDGSDSPPSRTKPIKPRSGAVKNEAILRQLSAMRERLNKEQIRVKSALRRKEYGDDVFSDDEGPGVTSEYLLKDDLERLDRNPTLNSFASRRPSANKPPPSNRAKSVRPSSTYDDLFDGRKNNKSNEWDDEDPPLVKLIKNSRTSASNFARMPPNQQRKPSPYHDSRSAFSDDDTPTNSRGNPNANSRRPVLSDDDSDPDAVVNDYMSKRGAGAKAPSRNPTSTNSVY